MPPRTLDLVHQGQLLTGEQIATALQTDGAPGPIDPDRALKDAALATRGREAAGVCVNPTEAPWCYLH